MTEIMAFRLTAQICAVQAYRTDPPGERNPTRAKRAAESHYKILRLPASVAPAELRWVAQKANASM
jgi:hypothetical protein